MVTRGTPRQRGGTLVQVLKQAPFPYSGKHEDTDFDFFDMVDPESGRRFHTNRHGERLAEAEHYRDGWVLCHVPAHFDPGRAFAYLVYFHELQTDVLSSVRRHELTRQVDAAQRNVLLVAPQLATDAADSSPGKFSRDNAFRSFMDEVAQVLTLRLGRSHSKAVAAAPILLAAFSGGYKAVAYILDRGGANDRVRGVLLLDALYEDLEKFERWTAAHIEGAFLVSLYTRGSCEENMHELLRRLARRGISAQAGWPVSLSGGDIRHLCVTTAHGDVPLHGPPLTRSAHCCNWPSPEPRRRCSLRDHGRSLVARSDLPLSVLGLHGCHRPGGRSLLI